MSPGRDEAARSWLRTVAGCAVLVGLAFLQSPGYLVADTKFDLAEAPGRFLSRALHMWDPVGAFGQLQNQAYGYLWPMGPFFRLGDLAHLEGWVVQRLWLALVLCVAFVGTVRLAKALGVTSDLAAIVAGFAYATSPRMLTTLGPISIEAWPSALAPWVLLPLVVGASRGSPRRMAALSALAIAMVGGVNAAATAAVLPLGAIWLLTRKPGARRRSLMLWWPVFTAMGTLWWLVPLFLLGSYSPPFLDYIESATVTTFPTTISDAFRGTSAWTPYIDPALRAGHDLVTEGYPALNSGIVLMLGLVGLMLRTNPHRRYLVLSVLVGLALVTMGHLGSVQGWFAEPLREALDGPLAAARNVHKFDPVVRLPMVLGLAWALQHARSGRPTEARLRRRVVRVPAGAGVVGLSLVAVVGAAVPALTGSLAPTRAVFATPAYWQQAVDWLDGNAGGTVSLLAPGSGFAQYVWGAPDDEPVQYLGDAPWAVRNAIPLAPAGNIRMLDAFEERLAQGRPSSGLAAYLRRAGVGHLVVRNDLAADSGVPSTVLVHQAIEGSPGLRRVRTFGPLVGGEPYLTGPEGRAVVEGGWVTRRPAVEVYRVTGAVEPAVTVSDLPTVVGGPEDLLGLADAGLVGSEPTLLGVDAPADRPPDGDVVVTDGLAVRERFFGRIHDGGSAATTPGDVRRSGNPVRDYVLDDTGDWSTTVRLVGARSIAASSSRADADAIGGTRPGELPYAAVDGDLRTSWVSNPGSEEVPWWRIDLDRPQVLSRVTVVTGEVGPERLLLRVSTKAGSSDLVELAPGRSRTVPVPAGRTEWIRVESLARTPHQLSLREVAWRGSAVSRRLVTPELPSAWGTADHVLLRARADFRTGCVEVDGRVPCRPERTGSSEEPFRFDRVVPMSGSRTYDARLTAVARPGTRLESLLQRRALVNVFGSSSAVDDPRSSGIAAMDGDPGTSWAADPEDERPRLAISWLAPRRIDSITVGVTQEAPVRRPTEVLLTWPEGEREVRLDRRGRATFRPVRTDELVVEVREAEGTGSLDAAGGSEALPVGVTEIRLGDRPGGQVPLATEPRRWGCATGPVLEVDGTVRRTRLVASPRDLFDMREVRVEPCGTREVTLTPGDNLVSVSESPVAVPRTLLLTSGREPVTPTPAGVSAASPSRVTYAPAGGDVLAARHNSNPGWDAVQDGDALEAVTLDGWQQGWRLADPQAEVSASFTPDRTYRWGLLGGLGLLAGLALLVLLPARPARLWPGADLPAVDGERIPAPVMVLAVFGLAGVLAGWGGAAIAAVGLVAALRLRHHLDHAAWVVASLPAVVGVAYLLRPWASGDDWAGDWSWPHYLVLTSLVGSAFVALRPRFTVARRMKGRSTRR